MSPRPTPAVELPEPFWADDALQRVLRYVRRFGSRHLTLATYSALPLGLTPELLHLIRINFVRPAPPIAEADLLLSPLCDDVGGGMYEMLPGVRELLLGEFDKNPALGRPARARVAEFLRSYAAHYLRLAPAPEARDFLEAQLWTAQAYLSPSEAAESLASALGAGLAGGEPAKALRVAGVARALSAPLIAESRVVVYAAAVEEIAGEDAPRARQFMRAVGPLAEDVHVGGVTLPSPRGLALSLRPNFDFGDQHVAPPEPGATVDAPAEPPHGLKLLHTLRRHEAGITRAAWRSSGEWLLTAGLDGRVMWWAAEDGTAPSTVEAPTRWLTSLAASPSGWIVYSGTGDGQLFVVDTSTSAPARRYTRPEAHADQITSIAVTPDGRRLLTASWDKTVKVWDGAERAASTDTRFDVARVLEGHEAGVNAVAVTPSGRHAVTASWDQTLRLWDIESGELLRTFEGHTASVNAVVVTPDGRRAASASDDATIRVWDLETGRAEVVLEGHLSFVTGLAISADGRLLASKSADDTVRLWRCDTWQTVSQIHEPLPETSTSGALAFHPYRPLLATLGDGDRAIRLWEYDDDALLGAQPDDTVRFVAAKIVIVGEPGVGKTELGRRLAHDEFKEAASTSRQHFWVLRTLARRFENGIEREALMWEHTEPASRHLAPVLPLKDADLALILLDPAEGPLGLERAESLIKQLELEGWSKPAGSLRQRQAILVGTRSDRAETSLTRGVYEEFCRRHNIEGGYIETSALRGEGFEELHGRIASLINWDELPATTAPRAHKLVRDHVLSLKERAAAPAGGEEPPGRVSLEARELRKELWEPRPETPLEVEQIMAAVAPLEQQGFVHVLRTLPGFERILLAPELLDDAAAALLNVAARDREGHGRVNDEAPRPGGEAADELEGLAQADADALLDAAILLMLEGHACLRETAPPVGQLQVIFPTRCKRLREFRADAPTAINGPTYHGVSPDAGSNLMAALTIQLGYTQAFTNTERWVDAARFETPDGQVCEFRRVAVADGVMSFTLNFGEHAEARTRALFQGLFESFLSDAGMVDVSRSDNVVCPNGHDLDRLARPLLREDIGVASCPRCGEKLQFSEPTGPKDWGRLEAAEVARQRRFAELRTRFELAAYRLQTYARQKEISPPPCFISYARGDEQHAQWVARRLATDLKKAGVRVLLDVWDYFGTQVWAGDILDGVRHSEFIVAVGTPRYAVQFEHSPEAEGVSLSGEAGIISERAGAAEPAPPGVLPVLLEGDEQTSLPPPLRGRVHADLRREDFYFINLFDLILRVHGISTDDPAVAGLRRELQPEVAA